VTTDVTQVEELNIERQAIRALAWLARYIPTFYNSEIFFLQGMETIVTDISSLIKSGAPDIEDDGFQALDTIHDALQSSLFDAGEPVGCPLMPWSELTILLAFWTATTPPDKYWTARLEQIKQSEFARLICSGLLERQLQMHRPGSSYQQIPESCVLLTGFLLEEYSCESQDVCKTFCSINRSAFSWASSGRSNEEEETHMLIGPWSCRAFSDFYTQTGSSEDCRDTLLATFDAKQVFFGGKSRLTRRKTRSLQIAMPLQHVIRGHKTVFPSSFKRMQAVLQLICFDPFLTGDDNTNYRFLELSVQLTGYVLKFCTATPDVHELWVSGSGDLGDLVFAGTLQQRQECLQLIIQEVWQNTNDQLDAWGQLLLLACVKKSFSTYWEIVASDGGSEAGKIANDSDSGSCSTSSESPQQPSRPSSPYFASPSKRPSAKAQLHLQQDP
jgi:hypothetical protein